ncbi:NAD(P)H-dependent oxidoreductase [Rhizobium sp. SSA_523]|jgi:putative NADPH-quinone reductase|uniref:NAD(P)H-dependent oxidoreductase n=1 Tax=Rhizobium sp. SSA_523 TaxID=2952477 RepID=UPI002090F2B9|nr:NAD(P)H-dependent oxidoreductase [Rhizobium sp. SSA_523]MCO5734454.1 NAD(P)H-dependent oxidoreductase [Rhizobium sp. SSA_523]WKC23295.1 NAD(P)H-dependent oxidoreductase [Rhizobium sp. SSA_523]
MRVLVLFAHPAQRKKSINLAMADRARLVEGITVADLYAEYPRFLIDVDREQRRLLTHDVIVFQFPLFWYSTPALLKQWQDLVLEYGFAYGPAGKKLAGKHALVCVTTGGSRDDYSAIGGNEHPIEEFLLPLRQTSLLCGMDFLPPFVLHAANHIEASRVQAHIETYPLLLTALRDDHFDFSAAHTHQVLSVDDLVRLMGG